MLPANGILDDVRALRKLPDDVRSTTLINIVTRLAEDQQKLVIFDLIERREIPRTLPTADRQLLADAAGVSTAVIEDGLDVTADLVVSRLLKVRPPAGPLDAIAIKAAAETRKAFEEQLATYPNPRLAQRGITGTVEKVTGRLNSLELDDARRLVLAQPSVYEFLFLDALDAGAIPDDDDAGILDHILNHLDDGALLHLLLGVVKAVLAAELIQLPDLDQEDIARLAVTGGLKLRAGQLTPDVKRLVDIRRRQGIVPRLVDLYLAKQEIAAEAVDEALRQIMIAYLVDLRLSMTTPQVVAGEFDEYFAVAYDEARRRRAQSDDPIDIARSGRRPVTPPSFTIPRIGEVETTIIRPQAIRAAGALFSIFVEGELMRMFDITDAVSLDWHRGGLDISEGEIAALLNRIEHLRDDRLDESERGMLYRRLFNYGQAEILSGTLVNERFGEYFDRLMFEVTRLVDLQDRAFNDSRQISRAGVISAIVSLQQNLSQFVTGSAFTKIEELLSHLNECHDLLTSAPILARYGGIEQSVSSSIKNMGLYFLDVSLPVEDLFELAERGNDVFGFIADFSRGSLREEPFQDFLVDAQQTIIARAAIDEGAWYPADRDYRRGRRWRAGEGPSGNGHRAGNGAVPAPATDVIDDWDR
jgi:hypothetical protein